MRGKLAVDPALNSIEEGKGKANPLFGAVAFTLCCLLPWLVPSLAVDREGCPSRRSTAGRHIRFEQTVYTVDGACYGLILRSSRALFLCTVCDCVYG